MSDVMCIIGVGFLGVGIASIVGFAICGLLVAFGVMDVFNRAVGIFWAVAPASVLFGLLFIAAAKFLTDRSGK
jgi:hypothetical protein